jgi:hypothetical protein
MPTGANDPANQDDGSRKQRESLDTEVEPSKKLARSPRVRELEDEGKMRF